MCFKLSKRFKPTSKLTITVNTIRTCDCKLLWHCMLISFLIFMNFLEGDRKWSRHVIGRYRWIKTYQCRQKCDCIFSISLYSLLNPRWPRGLRRGSAAARLLGLWVRILPRAWTSVCCECCMLSGRGLCVGLITRPEESYRVWCVWVGSWTLDNEEGLDH